MKLVATEDENGGRSVHLDYGESVPDEDSAKLIQAAHNWLWDPTMRRLDEEEGCPDPR